MAAPPPAFDIVTAGEHLRITNAVALASGAIIFYDYALTFSDEVIHVWKKKTTLLSVLFLTNRYFTPLALVITLFAFFYSGWTIAECNEFAHFEGAMTFVTVIIAEAILIIRVHAVHQRQWWTLAVQLPIYFAQMAMMIWSIHHTTPIILPRIDPSLPTGCVLGTNPEIVNIDMTVTFLLVPSLVFDLVTFVLLYLARGWKYGSSKMYEIILRDGMVYFLVVFITNLAWTITSLTLVEDLQQILATMSTVITNVMIGRLTLNLRASYDELNEGDSKHSPSSRRSRLASMRFMKKRLGRNAHEDGTILSSGEDTVVSIGQDTDYTGGEATRSQDFSTDSGDPRYVTNPPRSSV